MPLKKLTKEEFKEKCFCPCDKLEFKGSLHFYEFTGMWFLPLSLIHHGEDLHQPYQEFYDRSSGIGSDEVTITLDHSWRNGTSSGSQSLNMQVSYVPSEDLVPPFLGSSGAPFFSVVIYDFDTDTFIPDPIWLNPRGVEYSNSLYVLDTYGLITKTGSFSLNEVEYLYGKYDDENGDEQEGVIRDYTVSATGIIQEDLNSSAVSAKVVLTINVSGNERDNDGILRGVNTTATETVYLSEVGGGISVPYISPNGTNSSSRSDVVTSASDFRTPTTNNLNYSVDMDEGTSITSGELNYPLDDFERHLSRFNYAMSSRRTTKNMVQFGAVVTDDDTVRFQPWPVQLAILKDSQGRAINGVDDNGKLYEFDVNNPDCGLDPETGMYTPQSVTNNNLWLSFDYKEKDPLDGDEAYSGKIITVFSEEDWIVSNDSLPPELNQRRFYRSPLYELPDYRTVNEERCDRLFRLTHGEQVQPKFTLLLEGTEGSEHVVLNDDFTPAGDFNNRTATDFGFSEFDLNPVGYPNA